MIDFLINVCLSGMYYILIYYIAFYLPEMNEPWMSE